MINSLTKTIFGKKYVVSIPPAIMDIDFNGNFLDKVTNTNAVAFNNVSFVSGKTPNTQAVSFNVGTVEKSLSINSDKITISFDIKTTQTGAVVVLESMEPSYLNNAFGVVLNDGASNRFMYLSNESYNLFNWKALDNHNINDGNWHEIVVIEDRSLDANNQIKIYVDKVLVALIDTSLHGLNTNNDLNINYTDAYMKFGGRSSYFYQGALQNFKMFDTILTQEQINLL